MTPRVTPNYREADIRQVIEAVAEVTRRNFVVDRRVDARVTWLNESPLDTSELYSAFVELLESYGYAALDAGEVVRIVPADAPPP